jgi:hypothetical protein
MLLGVRTFACPLLALALLALWGLTASSAQAEEELLRGPHPFIKDNELVVHAGYSAGLGDNMRGLRVQGDYLNRLAQTLWLDIQMGVVSGSCHTNQTVCTNGSGNGVDILGGAAWKFQTNLPLVPYAKVAMGPIFLFPDNTRSAWGLLVRGGFGAHYFLYDWFGVGAEFTGAWGVAFFDADSHRTGSLGSVDINLGVALQF